MNARPPEGLLIDWQPLTVLERVLTTALPAEGCALLLGRTGPSWHVQLVWPALNCWPDAAERCRRFGLDPREQLLAQRWGRQRGLQVLGCAHSHPCSEAIPSPTDLALNLAPALLLIRGQKGEWRSWWINDEPAGLQEVPFSPAPCA